MATQQHTIVQHRPVATLPSGLLAMSSLANGGRPNGGLSGLQRQTSIYSLTLDELQNTIGGEPGKPFGSMNMDELMRNIWNAEESQAVVPAQQSQQVGQASAVGQNSLQRQPSLTLPGTLSEKTVEEVWRDIHSNNNLPLQQESSQATKQPTLGDMTLEDFLARAGVTLRDEVDPLPSAGTSFVPYTASVHAQAALVGSNISNQGNFDSFTRAPQPDWLSSFQFKNASAIAQQQQLLEQTEYQMKPFEMAAAGIVPGGVLSLSKVLEQAGTSSSGRDLVGFDKGAGSTLPANGGNRHVVNTDATVPRGKKRVLEPVVEKVVERRQKRMIKNRESAARSRARKQAYTVELEAEVSQLKEENEMLKREMEMEAERRKQEVLAMIQPLMEERAHAGPTTRLRRTRTGPW